MHKEKYILAETEKKNRKLQILIAMIYDQFFLIFEKKIREILIIIFHLTSIIFLGRKFNDKPLYKQVDGDDYIYFWIWDNSDGGGHNWLIR